MAVDFSNFTASNTIPLPAYFVGYEVLASGGERKWTLSSVANAVSGVMTTELNNAFFNTTDVIPIANGGTGQTTAFAGLVALANGGASTGGKYLKVNAGNTALEYDTIDLSTADVTGVLPIANGGTGGTTGFTQSLVQDGWQKLPSNLIIQWFNITSTVDGNQVFNFPLAFPTSCYSIAFSHATGGATINSTSQFTINRIDGISGTITIYGIAIGK